MFKNSCYFFVCFCVVSYDKWVYWCMCIVWNNLNFYIFVVKLFSGINNGKVIIGYKLIWIKR